MATGLAAVPRAVLIWIALAFIGYAILPWHLESGRFLRDSGLALGVSTEPWLLPMLAPLLLTLLPLAGGKPAVAGRVLVAAGAAGLALLLLQGFAIGLSGWRWSFLAAQFGEPGPRQGGMGYGAALTAAAFLILVCQGLAARGFCRGDAFVVSSIGVVVALIAI